MSLWTLVPPSDEVLIQRMFANGENGGYWPALRQYAYEDSAGTTQASVNGRDSSQWQAAIAGRAAEKGMEPMSIETIETLRVTLLVGNEVDALESL